MPSDSPDDMNNPGFSPRQLEQLGQILDQKLEQKLDQKLDQKLAPFMTRDEAAHLMSSLIERYHDHVKVMFDPVYAKLEAMEQTLTTVKPRVDMLVAAELSSRVGRLERKVFPPARSRRAPAKRSRGRRG